MNYIFEWDPIKAAKNKRKHNVSFEEAAEVFLDPLQLNMLNGKTDDIEERWITIGATRKEMLRLVVHTFIEPYEGYINVRIISARPATKHEQQNYEDL